MNAVSTQHIFKFKIFIYFLKRILEYKKTASFTFLEILSLFWFTLQVKTFYLGAIEAINSSNMIKNRLMNCLLFNDRLYLN